MNLLNKDFDLQNYDVVRNLIFNKKEIFSYIDSKQENKFLSHEISSVNIEIIEYVENIYITLIDYIKICEFNSESTEIISLLFEGLEIDEISKKMNLENRTIFNRIRRIVLRINLIAKIERCSEK